MVWLFVVRRVLVLGEEGLEAQVVDGQLLVLVRVSEGLVRLRLLLALQAHVLLPLIVIGSLSPLVLTALTGDHHHLDLAHSVLSRGQLHLPVLV
jgi:hypothetical protein